MSLIPLGTQSLLLTREKGLKEYQMMCNTCLVNDVRDQLTSYLETHEEDSTSKRLEQLQEKYDSEQGSLETQLEAINAQIESYQKAVSQNVKNECKLDLSV